MRSLFACLFLALVVTSQAMAETVLTGGSFGGGFLAPLTVLTSLLGLLALGLWASDLGGKSAWQLPALCLTAMIAAGVAHQAGLRLPPYARLVLEGGLVVFGGLVALQVRLPIVIAAAIAAVWGVAQGVVLAGWAGAMSVPLLFWLGSGTGGLLAASAGVGLAAVIGQGLSPQVIRGIGVAIAICGGLMLVGLL